MLPNIILPVFSVALIDKLGIIKSLALFAFLLFAAQSIVTFAIFWKSNYIE